MKRCLRLAAIAGTLLLLPSLALAQQTSRLAASTNGGEVIGFGAATSTMLDSVAVGGFGAVKIQTLDDYTGVWEVQCALDDAMTWDTDHPLKLQSSEGTTVLTEVSDGAVGTWDVLNANGCRYIRAVVTAGFDATDTEIWMRATQVGGGASAGGSGSAVLSDQADGLPNTTDGLQSTSLTYYYDPIGTVWNRWTASVAVNNYSSLTHLDGAAWTTGTTRGFLMMGRLDPDTLDGIGAQCGTAGDQCVYGITPIGSMPVSLFNPATGAAYSLASDIIYGATTYTETTSTAPGFVVRNDTLDSLVSANNEFTPLAVDADGALWSRDRSVATLGTTAFTDTSSLGNAIAVRNDSLDSLVATTNRFSALGLNALGALYTQPTAGDNGGATPVRHISVGASEDKHAVCTADCNLYSITVTNENAAARYLKCENDTTGNTAPGSETPEFSMMIPATGGAAISYDVGLYFSTALTCWLVTGSADSDVAEVAANELKVNYGIKQ